MKYLLIDGNNLAYRCAFANAQLKNQAGESTSVHYGFFNSIFNFRQQFPGYTFLVSWDGKSKRRVEEAKAGVAKGIVRSGYKENRPTELRQEVKDFYAQAPFLKRAIEQAGIPQIRIPYQETDDIIYTYCKTLGKDNEIVCVTGDEDYYQLLDDNVSIWNGGKQKMITKDGWMQETGLTPDQHVHVGALMGDSGDNIFGVYGIGEKTAIEMIKEHGTWEKTIEALHTQLDPLRVQYPDLNGDSEDFKRLAANRR